MKNHKNQITAAVVISVLFVLFCAVYAALYFTILPELPVFVRVCLGGIMIALAISMLVILRNRIREIRKGETDDLNNY